MPISKSYDQNNFASFYSLKMHQKHQRMFELFLQFSRSPGSPVCKPCHMGKCMLKLLFKIDQNHYFHQNMNIWSAIIIMGKRMLKLLFKIDQNPYFHQNMNIWSAIWAGAKTGETRIAKTIRSKSTQAPNKISSIFDKLKQQSNFKTIQKRHHKSLIFSDFASFFWIIADFKA